MLYRGKYYKTLYSFCDAHARTDEEAYELLSNVSFKELYWYDPAVTEMTIKMMTRENVLRMQAEAPKHAPLRRGLIKTAGTIIKL